MEGGSEDECLVKSLMMPRVENFSRRGHSVSLVKYLLRQDLNNGCQ